VFNYVNIHVYHYAGNNPVKYVDPDGRKLAYAPSSSSKFKLDVFMMKLYLLARGNYALIRGLDNRPETIYIRQGRENEFRFDADFNEIIMDTRSGLKVGEGRIQSPALGFLHEVGHALQFRENPAAIRMGEPTRDNQGNSEEVLVKSPTYTENNPKNFRFFDFPPEENFK
jgi:hypothetical protein